MAFGIKRNWITVALSIWGGLMAGVAIYGALHPDSHTVYNIYAPSSRNLWAGRDLYAPIIKHWQEAGVPAATTDYFRYSPLFAIFLTPFAVLPDFLGNPMWKLFNCGGFLFGIWSAGRWLFPIRMSPTQMALLFLLVLPTAMTSIYNGQANLLMVGALLLGATAAASDRWNAAAVWLAAATLIKGYPLAFALLMGTLFPKRFLLRFTVALGLGLLLPFLAQWPCVVLAQYASWLDHIRDSTGLMRERLRSIANVFQILSSPLSSQTYAWTEMMAGGVVLGWSFLHVRRTAESRDSFTWLFSLFATWVILFGPATESCTYVIISPVIAWCLIDSFRRPASWGTRCLLIISLILMGPLSTDLFGSPVRIWAHRYGCQPFGGLLFLVHLVTKTVQSFPSKNQRKAGVGDFRFSMVE